MIWLPDGSVGQCGIVRAILLPRFGQSVLKMGGGWVCVCVGGGGGGGGVNLTLGLFLETISHRRLTKLTYPPPPPSNK